MDKLFVYGIDAGCCYEGGGVHGDLYATEELARKWFDVLLAKRVEQAMEMNEFRAKEIFDGEEKMYEWTKRDGYNSVEYWSDGYEYLSIEKMEVVTQ
jgi:dsRNA-specific ribonuclease